MSQSSYGIVGRKNFDIQEAVVLLDVYLSVKKQGKTNVEAARIASQRLRALARSRGMAVDSAFRSTMGLQNRLRSIGCLFEGTESESAPGTQAFRTAIDLYRTDRRQYESLLKSAFPAVDYVSSPQQAGSGINMEAAEACLAEAGLRGATVQELIGRIQPGAAVSPTLRALDACENVVAMPGRRYVHAGAFVDLDEAEEAMGRILQSHFTQFSGYSNQKLLFGAVSHDLSMFLNDNDCEDSDSVYALARHFFGTRYLFSHPHIFENPPDFPLSLKGLMIHLARLNGGILSEEEAKDFLQKTMFPYGSINHLLQLSSSDTFLIYDSHQYLLTEALGIDETWKRALHDRLAELFRQADAAYIIPRDMKDSWLKTLPALPRELNWTILLLQEVLSHWPDIGFRPVTAELGQPRSTIAAALVPEDSPLELFPDVVALFMAERHTLPKRMSREELRRELREAGMLAGGELAHTLPRALNDYRFSWTGENKTVLVRGY